MFGRANPKSLTHDQNSLRFGIGETLALACKLEPRAAPDSIDAARGTFYAARALRGRKLCGSREAS